MTTKPLLLLAISLLGVNANLTNAQIDSTKINGDVSGIWPINKSPYFVIGNITVPTNDTLVIQPGVRVLFMGHYQFSIRGLLLAIGKSDSMIVFDGINPSVKWNGIQFSNAHDSCLIKYCEIQNGHASGSRISGGGVSISNCSPKLIRNIIRSNQADSYGGGIYIIGRSASPVLDANHILGNTARDGGGVFINDHSSPSLTNNIIARNGAISNGDGIYIDFYSKPRIINNTIVDNNLPVTGRATSPEGIFLYNSPSPIIINNIITNHGFVNRGGTGINSDYTFVLDSISTLDYNNVWGNNTNYRNVPCGEHDISDDPRFVDPGNGDYHIQPNSIVVDKGTNDGTPVTDIDGNVRPSGLGVDIGVDEDMMNVALPPKVPSLVSPPNSSTEVPRNPTLKWNSSSKEGAVSYRVQISTDSCFSPPSGFLTERPGITDTAYVYDSNLIGNRKFFWRVDASNQLGTSIWSSVWSFTTTATPPRPRLSSPPDGAINRPTTLTLFWYDVGDVTYRLQVSTSLDFATTTFDDSTIVDFTQKVDSLVNSTTYYWRVKAKSSYGWGPWSSVWSFTTIMQLPNRVSLILPLPNAVIATDTVKFTWRQSQPAVSRYWFEIATDSSMTNASIDSSLMAVDTTLVRELLETQVYWWRVKARNVAGWGPFAESRQFRIVLPTDIHTTEDTPKEFSLSQNYPNPFNPSTIIAFSLPQPSHVTLKVLNPLGKEIIVLANKKFDAGRHEVIWDAKGVASGIYFYRLQSERKILTKKMILIQ